MWLLSSRVGSSIMVEVRGFRDFYLFRIFEADMLFTLCSIAKMQKTASVKNDIYREVVCQLDNAWYIGLLRKLAFQTCSQESCHVEAEKHDIDSMGESPRREAVKYETIRWV